jgi:hypothetical protein
MKENRKYDGECPWFGDRFKYLMLNGDAIVGNEKSGRVKISNIFHAPSFTDNPPFPSSI